MDNVARISERKCHSKRAVGWLLRKAGYSLTRIVPRTKLVCQHIPGWFSIPEAEALYELASLSFSQRFLEVGHFLGRSTSVICEAIRDTDAIVEFNSYDLGFSSAEEFVNHYKRVHATTATCVPLELEKLVFSRNRTTTEIARQNLERFDLGRHVNLISGDFTVTDQSQYGLILCDALHDHKEIEINLPHVVNASADECVWAFHDMTAANVATVMNLVDARHVRTIDTLGIFRFRR